ncbi:uncharacterized protein AAG666_009141 isoform 2-T6 [Megaptera novaeangliae]
MQKLLITFRNDEQKIGDRPLLKCFGNCSSFTFLLWQGSAEKSPKMLSTVKDSHWLKNNGSLVWCQNRKQCSKPISFRIPPEGSTKTLLSQAKARGQVTVNWMELTAEQRLERNLLSFGKNRTIPCVQDRNFYRCFMKEKISYQSYYCTISS